MDIKLERTCWTPSGCIKTRISSHFCYPVDVGVLQEKLASSVTELSTHLAQVSERLKQNPGEAKAAAAWPLTRMIEVSQRTSYNVHELQ